MLFWTAGWKPALRKLMSATEWRAPSKDYSASPPA